MANPFDQFDEAGGGNPFDQFDEQASNPVMNDGLDARTLNQMPSLAGEETSTEDVRSNIEMHKDQEGFSDFLRNPLGSAADYMFPSIKEKRERLQAEGKLDENSRPVMEEGSLATYIPNLKTPDYLAADAAGGVYNAARSVGELGANALDLTGVTDESTRTFNEAIPRYKSDTGLGEAVSQGAGLIVPGAMGAKLGAGIVQGRTALATGGKIAGGILGGAVGTTLAGDTSQNGLLYGQGSLTGYGGEGGEKYTTDASAAMNRRKDMLVDALVTDSIGGAVTGAAMAAKRLAGNIIWQRFTRLVSQNTRDRAMVEEAVRPFLDVAEDASPQEIKAATINLLERARNEKTVGDAVRGRMTAAEWDALPDADKQLLATNQDAMSVFETLFNKDKTKAEMARDTLEEAGDIASAKAQQGMVLDADRKIAEARAMRSGIESTEGGAPLTRTASEKPISLTESILKRDIREGGGEEGVTKAGRALQERAKAEASSLDEEMEILTGQRKGLEEVVLPKRLKEDPVFGKALEKLGDNVNIDMKGLQNATEEEIRDKVSQALVKKTDELSKVMETAARSGASIDNADIIKAFKTTGKDGKVKTVKLKEISESLRNAFGADATFEKLYPRIPEITSEINRLMKTDKANARDAANALIRVKALLQNPKGTKAQKDAVAKSIDYYQKEWAPYFDQGPLGDFYTSFRQNKKALGGYPTKSALPGEGLATDFKSETRSAIQKGIGDVDYVGQTKRLLGETGDEGLISQHYGAQALADVQSKINTGTFKPEDMVEVVNKMSSQNPVVAGSPELKKQLDDLLTDVRNNRIDMKTLDTNIAQLQKDITKKQRDVYLNKFSEFYNRKTVGEKTVGVAPASNMQASFNELFTGNKGQNADRIAALRKEIEATGDPELKKGMEAAYMQAVREKFFKTSTSETGQSRINKELGTQSKDAILNYGEQVFGDKSKAAFFKGLVETAQEAASRKTTIKTEVANLNSIAPDAMNAVRFVVQHIFGPLSKPGGKVNVTARNLIQMTDQAGRIARADAVFSDFDTLYDLSMKYAKSKSPLPVEVRHYLENLQLIAGVKAAPDAVGKGIDAAYDWMNTPSVEEQTESAVQNNQSDKTSNGDEEEPEEETNYYE